MNLENHATKTKKPEFRLKKKILAGKGASYPQFVFFPTLCSGTEQVMHEKIMCPVRELNRMADMGLYKTKTCSEAGFAGQSSNRFEHSQNASHQIHLSAKKKAPDDFRGFTLGTKCS